jgi:UDP-glucose 4-epimerase
MSRILITGGNGYVGGRLSHHLSANNEIIVSSRKKLSKNELETIGATSSIAHAELLDASTFPEGIDTVIHLAALNEHDCAKNPSEAITVNIDHTRILLENAIAQQVKHFVYFSTVHVYASPLRGNISEETIPLPQHPYAITHKAAEDYVRAAAEQQKIKATIVRLSNSFGAPMVPTVNRWTLLINDLCRQAMEKGSITLLSPTNQLRDFITLTDVCKKVQSIVESESQSWFNLYNLSSNKALSLTDIASMIKETYKEFFQRELQVNFTEKFSSTVQSTLQIDNRKLVDAFGVLENNFKGEIHDLLMFCKTHFGNA